jgi:hypothetical protein
MTANKNDTYIERLLPSLPGCRQKCRSRSQERIEVRNDQKSQDAAPGTNDLPSPAYENPPQRSEIRRLIGKGAIPPHTRDRIAFP